MIYIACSELTPRVLTPLYFWVAHVQELHMCPDVSGLNSNKGAPRWEARGDRHENEGATGGLQPFVAAET